MSDALPECKQCDFEHPVQPQRFEWRCPNCGRDYTLEYIMWHRNEEKLAKEKCHE